MYQHKMDKEELDKMLKSEIDSTLNSLDLKSDSSWKLPAGIFSWLTTPLVCPVYGVILIFSLSLLRYLPTETRVVYILLTLALNAILPMLAFVVMKRLGIITDIGLNKRRERFTPYIVTILCMFSTAVLFWQKGAPHWVSYFFLGGVVAGIIEMIVNKWWKISAHSAGVAGLVALLVRMDKIGFPQTDLTWWIVGTILATGLLGTCRLYLRRHTLLQVIGGAMAGYTSVYLCMLL